MRSRRLCLSVCLSVGRLDLLTLERTSLSTPAPDWPRRHAERQTDRHADKQTTAPCLCLWLLIEDTCHVPDPFLLPCYTNLNSNKSTMSQPTTSAFAFVIELSNKEWRCIDW
ncbi:hypothetical protein BJ741DRAFT_603983 [Chytriomyces cf. hyalinus JEL632]|nr:hypothetical protein BJ741DRAFT_603983 [Chytriomyces cf. hyalinus JEL632]